MPRKNSGMWYEVHPTPVKGENGKNLVYYVRPNGKVPTFSLLALGFPLQNTIFPPAIPNAFPQQNINFPLTIPNVLTGKTSCTQKRLRSQLWPCDRRVGKNDKTAT